MNKTKIRQPAHLRLRLKAIDWLHYQPQCRCGGTTPQFLYLRTARRMGGLELGWTLCWRISDTPAVWSHCTDWAAVSLAAHIMTCRKVQGYVRGVAAENSGFWDVNVCRRFERLSYLLVAGSSSPIPRATAVPKVHTSSPNRTTWRTRFQLMLSALFQT